jgi:CubicO group peptidase (beta-lactamase class C family)
METVKSFKTIPCRKGLFTVCLSILVVLVIGVVFSAGCSKSLKKPSSISRGDYAPVKKYLESLIAREMKTGKIVGLSIVLIDDQNVVWERGFGFADKERKLPATSETIYRLGSVSKLFTSTAVMQLAEQGKLDIDKPVETYLPEFSIKSRFTDVHAITPRNIMTHHSGLPRDYLKGEWTKNPESFTRIIDLIKEEYTAYPPDYVFSYSSVGMTILGNIIERVGAVPFAEYMENQLFQPMGMKNSSFSSNPSASPLMSKSYVNGKEIPDTPLRDIPMGGMNSSAHDLGSFLSMQFAEGKSNGRIILQPNSVAEMLKPQNTDVILDRDLRVGLGWFLSAVEGNIISIENAGKVAHHEGGTIRFASEIAALPDNKLGVAVLVNSMKGMAAAQKIASQALALALEAKTGIHQPEQQNSLNTGAMLTREVSKKYIGNYAMGFGFGLFRVYGKNSGNLFLDMFGNTFHLSPHADGSLEPRYYLLGFIPLNLKALASFRISMVDRGEHEFLVVRAGGQELCAGEKIKPRPIPPAWLNRLGKYVWANPDSGEFVIIDGLRLDYRDNVLLADFRVWSQPGTVLSVPIEPVSDTEALLLMRITGMGETIRFITIGQEEQLSYSGYNFRKKLKR